MSGVIVTGSASGIGAAITAQLRAAGRRVITIDRHDAEIVADLATADGRNLAAREAIAAADDHLDGAVLAAGLGPATGHEEAICTVNTIAVIQLLTHWRPALARGRGRVVILGSNATTTTPLVPRRAVRKLRNGDVHAAVAILRRRGPLSPALTYAASKIAVTHWARGAGAATEWAGEGITVNVLAPGPVVTPLLEAQLAGPNARHLRRLPVPTRRFGDPDHIAAWATMMLGPAAAHMSGAVITVDGGTDAYLRTRDWPRTVDLHSLPALWNKLHRNDISVHR